MFFVVTGQDIDEDELERELEELEQEELDKDLLGVGPSTQDLPEVPTAEPAKEPASSSKDKKRGKRTHWPLPTAAIFLTIKTTKRDPIASILQCQLKQPTMTI